MQIAEGSSSIVIEGETEKQVKKVFKESFSPQSRSKEAQILELLRDEHIVSLIAFTEQYLVLERLDEKNLFDLVQNKALSRESSVQLSNQLIKVVDQIHKKGIAHRDIKLENVLLRGDQVVICDFGFAEYLSTGSVRRRVGTPQFMGPELQSESAFGKNSEMMNSSFLIPADIFSLGVTIFMLLYNMPPFTSTKRTDKCPYWALISSKKWNEYWTLIEDKCNLEIPSSYRYILESMLHCDPLQHCADFIIEYIILNSVKQLRVHELEAQVPSIVKSEFMLQIKSSFNLFTTKADGGFALQEDDEPSKIFKDSFQTRSLVNVPKPNVLRPNASIRDRQPSNIRTRITTSFSHVNYEGSLGVPDSASVMNMIDIQKPIVLKVQTIVNKKQIKQQIKDQTKHVFVDRTDIKEFKDKMQSMIDAVLHEEQPSIPRKPKFQKAPPSDISLIESQIQSAKVTNSFIRKSFDPSVTAANSVKGSYLKKSTRYVTSGSKERRTRPSSLNSQLAGYPPLYVKLHQDKLNQSFY